MDDSSEQLADPHSAGLAGLATGTAPSAGSLSVIDEYRQLWAVVELASRPGRCF
jgi:hypothetical protein